MAYELEESSMNNKNMSSVTNKTKIASELSSGNEIQNWGDNHTLVAMDLWKRVIRIVLCTSQPNESWIFAVPCVFSVGSVRELKKNKTTQSK